METKKDFISEDKKKEILFHAEKLLHYNNLLIEQCDRWLSEEEGNQNMMKSIMERRKEEAKAKRRNKRNSVLKFFKKFWILNFEF
jgi:hypothetical protein